VFPCPPSPTPMICGSNVCLRTVCSLYFNEIRRLSSTHNMILSWHTSHIDVKRTGSSLFGPGNGSSTATNVDLVVVGVLVVIRFSFR